MLSVNTNASFKYVFAEDRLLPEEQQRSLVFKYVSARRYAEIRKLFGEANEAADDVGTLDKITQGIKLALVGWNNLTDDDGNKVDFDLSKLDQVCTRQDLCEVWGNLLEEMTLTAAKKKRSAWQSISTMEKPANETVTASVSQDAQTQPIS